MRVTARLEAESGGMPFKKRKIREESRIFYMSGMVGATGLGPVTPTV